MINIKKLNNISSVVYDYLPKEKYTIAAECDECQGFIVRSADCHEVEMPNELLAIARAGAGTNNIPVEKCAEKGIVVFNTPGANANGVKELVIGAMITSCRNMVEAYEWAKTLKGKEGVPKLVEKGKSQFTGGEVKGKTLGVIGLGAIGVMVANSAFAIGMNVIGYDPFLSVDKAWNISMYTHRAAKLEELLEKSDFISLHIPQTNDTKGFIGAPEFAKMKKGAILLNFARGGLVNTNALLEAISDKTVAKYVTDFPDDDMLCKENILAIPHLGASTPESEENCAVMAAKQLRDFFETGSIVNSVNMPECIVSPTALNKLAIIHKNMPTMVSQITNVLADKTMNIADMVNKSRGDIAYTVLSIDQEITEDVVAEINKISDVIKTRVIK